MATFLAWFDRCDSILSRSEPALSPLPFVLRPLPLLLAERGAKPMAAAFLESSPAALGVYATPMRSLAA